MGKLPSLNGLRALSVFFVILYHLCMFNFGMDQRIFTLFPISNGRFGVNIFFVISGFLITYLLLREEEKAGKISLRNFYTRRVLRIFPAYYFLLFVYFILQNLHLIYISHYAWVTALTYTKYLPNTDYYTGHAWSLSIEETFYIVWPLIFILGRRVRGYCVIFLIVAEPCIRLFSFFHPVSWLYEESVLMRIDSIALGCFVAMYLDKILKALSSHWDDLFLWSVVVLIAWPWISLVAEGTPLYAVFAFLGTLTGTLSNFCIALILLYSVYGPRGWWYRMLNTRVLNYLGVLSYSIYLWQQPFVLKRDWWVTHFPQNLLCIFAAAMFSYYLIERPFLRLKKKFSGKGAPKPSPELRMQSV